MISFLSAVLFAGPPNPPVDFNVACQQAFQANCPDPVYMPGLEKFTASFTRYPAGNLSYLYDMDKMDWFFVVLYFGILGILALCKTCA